MASNLRKRNVTKPQDAEEEEPVTFYDNVKESFSKIIFSGSKDKNIRRIEDMSVGKYIILFLVFLAGSVYLVNYLHSLHDELMAGHLDIFTRLFVDVPCSNDYGKQFPKCVPKKCGRSVRDNLFKAEHLDKLKAIAEKGMSHGGGSGGASILDLHSGALSYKDKFVNIHQMKEKIFEKEDFQVYSTVKNKIRKTIATEFNVDEKDLYLTHPTFFSRMNNKPAVTSHDEYWHPHIDRLTYPSFFYTSLLYLSTFNDDFTGGRFIFIDSPCNKTVEPRKGRLSFFTSGSENQHFVEKVESGVRYAITVSFTCDKKFAIKDPSLKQ